MTRLTSPLAKLTPAQVRKVRQLYGEGRTQIELAEEFHVSQATISKLLDGIIYKRVEKTA